MDLPIKAAPYLFKVGLESQASPGILQANPTLATGDVKISKDGGTFGNLATLPTVTPTSGKAVLVQLSATEMDADDVVVVFNDATGSEWFDLLVNIKTLPFLGSTVDNAVVTPTTTTIGSDLSGHEDDYFNGAFIHFLSGILQGQSKKITDYASANGQLTFSAFTDTPSDGDRFIITGRSE